MEMCAPRALKTDTQKNGCGPSNTTASNFAIPNCSQYPPPRYMVPRRPYGIPDQGVAAATAPRMQLCSTSPSLNNSLVERHTCLQFGRKATSAQAIGTSVSCHTLLRQ